MKKVEFHEDGDKELWLLNGDGWCIPIYAIPRKADGYPRVWFIEQAMLLDRASKYKAMCSALRPFNISNDKNIMLKEEDLPKAATKAQGVTPRYYAKWENRLEREPLPKAYESDEIFKETNSSQAEAFLKFVEQETQAASLPVIKLVYTAIKKCGPIWLLEKQKPIDLGFCKIHALPLRQNWKVFMDVWMPNCLQLINQREDKARVDMVNAGFGENLCDPMMLSVHEHKRHINWSLDIEELPSFSDESSRIESSRRSALGDVKYYNWVKNTISDMFNPIYELYARWTKATNQANGEVRASFRTCAEILLASRRKARNRPENHFRSGSSLGRPDWVTENLQIIQGTRRPSVKRLPQVSNLQPPEGDMRDSGPTIDS